MSSRVFAMLVLVGCAGASPTPTGPTPHPTASVASATPSAPAWHPLLYRIDGSKPSYLFGTVHVPDPRIAVFPPELDEAIANANEIVGELPPEAAGNASVAGAFVLPPDKSLATELPPALYQRLKKAFEDRGLGAAFPMLEHSKVWVVAIQVSVLDHAKPKAGAGRGLPIDLVIQQRAKAQGKPTPGLENPSDQLAVFDGLTRDEQARMLEQRLDQRDADARAGDDRSVKLMNAYVAGAEAPLLAELDAAYDRTRALDKKLFDRLITDRNTKLTDGIATMVTGHPTTSYFFAIGAAHLLGDDGVIARLRKRGMRVERVTP